MSDKNSQTQELSVPQEVGGTERTETCAVGKKGWLKGPLEMAICCGGPLLLVAVISLFGVSLGAIASGSESCGGPRLPSGNVSHDADDDEQQRVKAMARKITLYSQPG